MKAGAFCLLGTCLLAASPSRGAERARPIVGAIRWDAWHGEKGAPGLAVERSLGPARWRHRLPFFARVLPGGGVRIDGSDQDVMDREIAYAARAGLDYWAFVTYPPDSPMSLGLKRYLASRSPERKREREREKLRFCLITEVSRWRDPRYVERLGALMRERGYQTVLDGRPLLYIGFITPDKLRKHFQGPEGFRRVLDGLRQSVVRGGLGRPYVVVMDFRPAQGKRWLDAFGADAITSYATHAGGRGASYAALTRGAEGFWDRCRATGAQVVPIVMAGWDRRPRVEHPVPWETWQKAGHGIERFYHPPTPAELAGHVRNALKWLGANAPAARAQTALIYAWNENDEGGWLVPTRTPDGSADTARIDALAKALRPRGAGGPPRIRKD